MNESRRIDALRAYIGKSLNRIARDIGLRSSQVLYDIRNGKSNITPTIASKIHDAYPFISYDWLLDGKPPMFLTTHPVFEDKEYEIDSNDRDYAPFYYPTGYFAPSNLRSIKLSPYDGTERIVTPIKYTDWVTTVNDDSMEPDFPFGSIIYLRRIDFNMFIEWGEAYVVDTRHGPLLKILMPGRRAGRITCASINNNLYPPFEIKIRNIRNIYRVMMVAH